MKHIIAVVVLIAVVTVAVATWLNSLTLVPPLASAEGIPIDWLFGLHLQIIAFLFALIMVFMLYSVVVFRRKKGDTSDGAFIHGNTPLEIVWTIVPLVIVLYFGYLGVVTLSDITSPGRDELVVEVSSRQWSWSFHYPEYGENGIDSTDLNLPRGRTVLLKLSSSDVIHDFWVPEFRVKQDAVPGMIKDLRVSPTEIGTYKIRCAELCGLDHSTMYADVNVMSSDDFKGWVTHELDEIAKAEAGPAIERGKRVAELMGCQDCHSLDGSEGKGPTWLGIYGKEEILSDGSAVMVDDEYLLRSILEPGVQIVEGYGDTMPPRFGDELSEEQIADLIEYIESFSE